MKKFNVKSIGTAAGITVNTTEDLTQKIKNGVPAAKDATKSGLTNKWGQVKGAYKAVREGEDDARMQEPIAVRAIELTTGGK